MKRSAIRRLALMSAFVVLATLHHQSILVIKAEAPTVQMKEQKQKKLRA